MPAHEKLSPLFCLALKVGAHGAVVSHIRRGESLNGCNAAGLTPLMIAAAHGHHDICVVLLEAGADPTMISPGKQTAAGMAADRGYGTVSVLLSGWRGGLCVAADSDSCVAGNAAGMQADPPSQELAALSVVSESASPVPDAQTSRAETDRFVPVPASLEDAGGIHASSDFATSGDVGEAGLMPAVACTVAPPLPFQAVTGVPSVASGCPGVDADPEPGLRSCPEPWPAGPVVVLPDLDLVTNMADSGEWLPEPAASEPSNDHACVASARVTQNLISKHRSISRDADWSDAEMDLPEVILRAVALADDAYSAVRDVLISGLAGGYISQSQLLRTLDADFGAETGQVSDAVQRVLDDLGIRVEDEGLTAISPGADLADEELLQEALDRLDADLSGKTDIQYTYMAEAQKFGVIKRDAEERLGQRMDSALGILAELLAQLPASLWIGISGVCIPDEMGVPPAGDDEEEKETVTDGNFIPDEVPEEPGGTADVDFLAYVTALRDGAEPRGRDAAVPRPTAPELTRFLAAAGDFDVSVRDAVVLAVRDYERAKDQLTHANLRLVMYLARKYGNFGMTTEDLIQEGNIGLIKAVERYDFRRGYKFSTYATWWIKQCITRSIADRVRLIRVPVHMIERINVVNRAKAKLESASGKVATIEDIAGLTGTSPREVLRTIKSDREILSFADCGTDAAPGVPDYRCIEDPGPGPEQTTTDRSLSELISRMLCEFPERDRDVISLRHGLGGLDPMTLEEVGQYFSVTRERIRQIEAKVLGRLRHESRAVLLRPFGSSVAGSDN